MLDERMKERDANFVVKKWNDAPSSMWWMESLQLDEEEAVMCESSALIASAEELWFVRLFAIKMLWGQTSD